MIVPMKKVSLLIFYKEYQQFLGELREKGVVHIHENKKKSAGDETLKLKVFQIKRIGDMLRSLSKRAATDKHVEPEVLNDELVDFLEGKFKRLEQIEQQSASLQKDRSVYLPWGDFSQTKIDGLRSAGWDLRFFTAPDKKFSEEWVEKYNAFVVNELASQKYFVTVSKSGNAGELTDAEVFVFPKLSPAELDAQILALENESESISTYLNEVAGRATERLQSYRLSLYDDTDALKVDGAASVLVDERVIALEGWIPAEIEKDTDEWLSERGVYYEIERPVVGENPPIKLKNNKFARLFEFIGELYALPNYGEIDLTPFFAPFFVLFFGLCLGDAGYGLLILVGVSLFKLKAKPAMKPILTLAQWLGGGTVVMGFISGTFFGIPLLELQMPWIQQFKAYMLDSQQLFNLALIIGVVQIIFGMFLKVANKVKMFGWGAALSTIGWLVLILGGGGCYFFQTKGMDITIPAYVVGGLAFLLIFVFNEPKRNVLVNVGAGVWDSYNMVTGLLGDVLSYIRLFALGISSSVLGLVFNDLAMNMSGDIPVISQLLMLVILVFGHGVNIFIAGLGSFVHPMRLTFVEFYKNSGFEGGGKKYAPFKKNVA